VSSRAGLPGGSLGCALAALLVLAWPPCVRAGDPAENPRRGPLEMREEFLPVLPRLALPARAAAVLPARRTLLRLDFDWGNDFASRGVYLFDGEHRTLALSLRRGLGHGLEVGLRVPLHYRGGGLLDGIIEGFHSALDLPNGGRSRLPRDQLLVFAKSLDGDPLHWQGRPGTGLGNVEVEGVWASDAGRAAGAWSWGVLGRLALPTASGGFPSGGVEAGLQLLGRRALGGRVDLHAGLGGTLAEQTEVEGLPYERARGYLFVGLEWRVGRTWSLLAQADGAGRLLRDVEGWPGIQSYLRLGAKHDLGTRWRLEAAFTENITEQQATTDFGIWLGVARRF